MRTTTCRRCGRKIAFTFNARMRRVAIDPEPARDGDLLVEPDTLGELKSRRVQGVERAKAVALRKPLYHGHRKTCPGAPS